MLWVRVLSGLKKESTAETHNRRRPLLGGNSPPHIPNQRGNRKMCRNKTKIFHFFLKSRSGGGVGSTTGDRMVFFLLPGSSLMVGVVGWCLGQAPELGHQALQSLPEGIRCSALGAGDSGINGSLQLEVNQQIYLIGGEVGSLLT